jgi:hypothetical protein
VASDRKYPRQPAFLTRALAERPRTEPADLTREGRACEAGATPHSVRSLVEPNATDANPDGAHDVGSIPASVPS